MEAATSQGCQSSTLWLARHEACRRVIAHTLCVTVIFNILRLRLTNCCLRNKCNRSAQGTQRPTERGRASIDVTTDVIRDCRRDNHTRERLNSGFTTACVSVLASVVLENSFFRHFHEKQTTRLFFFVFLLSVPCTTCSDPGIVARICDTTERWKRKTIVSV